MKGFAVCTSVDSVVENSEVQTPISSRAKTSLRIAYKLVLQLEH